MFEGVFGVCQAPILDVCGEVLHWAADFFFEQACGVLLEQEIVVFFGLVWCDDVGSVVFDPRPRRVRGFDWY